MTDENPWQNNGGAQPKARDDDARGAPKGAGVIEPEHGGRIGNPKHVPTQENREKVRTLAKTFPAHARHFIARLIGVSVSTLDRHYDDDMLLGRAEMLAAVGAQVVNRALDASKLDNAKGDLDAQKFILARLGGWSTKLEVTGRDGGPVQVKDFDLSNLSDDEKRLLLGTVDRILDGEAQGEDDASAA
jgi:hypothetical protein